MKIISAASLVLALLLVLPLASASSVTRSLSPATVAPGGSLTVTLSVDVSGEDDYYAIDDTYPQGWSMVDAGIGSIEHASHWKHVVYENARDVQLTYVLRAPNEPGTYSFSGIYMFSEMKEEATIAGQSSVTVGAAALDTTWILLGVVIVIVVALLLFKAFAKK